ncbi:MULTISPECIES: Mov34/MPN/PAD-1 family protein [Bradyrhizobium]|uniref:Mov34/MPN/PAD-1 family protein n=1 Tax=Bradyrhizobium TaxID=374 RepID=UPI00385781D0
MRERLRLHRDDPGHLSRANRRWTESGRTHTFVGEWHTHPGFSSTPSAIDLKAWREVTRNKVAGNSVFPIRGCDRCWATIGAGRLLTRMSIVPPDDECLSRGPDCLLTKPRRSHRCNEDAANLARVLQRKPLALPRIRMPVASHSSNKDSLTQTQDSSSVVRALYGNQKRRQKYCRGKPASSCF